MSDLIDRHILADMVDSNGNVHWEDIANMPSTQPDLSEYSDKLWKAAYERGKAEAQLKIIRCSQCEYAVCLKDDERFCRARENEKL